MFYIYLYFFFLQKNQSPRLLPQFQPMYIFHGPTTTALLFYLLVSLISSLRRRPLIFFSSNFHPAHKILIKQNGENNQSLQRQQSNKLRETREQKVNNWPEANRRQTEATGQKHRGDTWCQGNKLFLSILVNMLFCEDILRISHFFTQL